LEWVIGGTVAAGAVAAAAYNNWPTVVTKEVFGLFFSKIFAFYRNSYVKILRFESRGVTNSGR
jgi:hypothetical protein